MTSSQESSRSPVLPNLVKRRANLCESASTTIAEIPAERESFLADNLKSALQQLELILRVLDEEKQNETTPSEDEPQGSGWTPRKHDGGLRFGAGPPREDGRRRTS